MRMVYGLGLAALLFSAAGVAALAADSGGRLYPFKTAIVTYEIRGEMQQGRQTLYIGDYGRKTRVERDTTITIMGREKKDSRIEIDDGEYRYRIDLATKTGEKTVSFGKRADAMLKSMTAEQKKALTAAGQEMVKGFSGSEEMKPVGKGTVAGRECAIYELMGVRTWQWNKLALKTESRSLGNMVQEATDVKTDVPIPPEKFTPPRDITMIEAACAGAE